MERRINKKSSKVWVNCLAIVTFAALVSLVGTVNTASAQQEEKPKTGKLNDDLWVEVKAQLLYEVGKVTDKYGIMPETPEAARKSLREMEAAQNKVYERFGVTKEDVDAYYEKLAKEDIQRVMKLSQRVAKRAQELAEKDRKPEPEAKYVKYLPDIPVFPGSKLNPESTEEAIWYEADASEKEVLSFYKDKLSKAGWKCYPTKFSLYFIKGDKAFELSMPSGEGDLQYRPLPPKRAIAESVDLDKDDYIAKVVAFAGKLLPYTQKWLELSKQSPRTPETVDKMFKADREADEAADKIGPEVGVTLSRLKEFNKNYAFELMDYLLKHPELKEKGIPAFLGKLEHWDALGSAVEDNASKNPQQAETLMKRYQKFATEWTTPWF
jgi:hypothetical protein